MNRTTLRTLGVSLVLFVAATASAGTRDAASAEVLFRDGREAMKRGDFATACPKLAESQRLDPAPGTLLNLSECEEKSGKLASAWQHARETLDQLPAGDDRVPIARKRTADLEKRVPRLTIRLADDAASGVTVMRDDVELGRASLGTKLPVDPGEHVVVVRAPGRKDARFKVSIAEGEAKTIGVAAGDLAPGEGEAGNLSRGGSSRGGALPADQPAPGKSQRNVGWGIAGVGVIGLIVGVAENIRWKTQEQNVKDNCQTVRADGKVECIDANYANDQQAARDRNQTISTVSYVVGGAALVGGVALVLSAPSSSGGATNQVRIGPAFGTGAAGVVAGGTW
jgi:hypothetical protein